MPDLKLQMLGLETAFIARPIRFGAEACKRVKGFSRRKWPYPRTYPTTLFMKYDEAPARVGATEWLAWSARSTSVTNDAPAQSGAEVPVANQLVAGATQRRVGVHHRPDKHPGLSTSWWVSASCYEALGWPVKGWDKPQSCGAGVPDCRRRKWPA